MRLATRLIRNKRIFAPGLLAGCVLSSTDRISVGGKSPLTMGIKESNAGGRTGLYMATFGSKALIIDRDLHLGAGGVVKRLLAVRYGWNDLPDNILAELGKQTLMMERELNRRAGGTEKDDRLLEWMTHEPLPPHNTVFDVPEIKLNRIFDDH